MAEGQKFAL